MADDFPAWIPKYGAFAGATAKSKQPTGAIIEIVEKGATTDETTSGSVIAPNEIRINGQPLLASADDPVVVHEIKSNGGDLVRVTLTLFARRVTFAAEGGL